MSETLTTLQAMYDTSTNKLDDMLGSCANQTQRGQVIAKYSVLEEQLGEAVNKVFKDNDPQVKALVTKAKSTTESIANLKKQVGTFATVLGYASDAASVATKIVALA